MVDLDLQGCECKDCYTFDKDKVYCLKIEVPEKYPKESIPNVCRSIVDAFSSYVVDIVVLPQTEGGLKFEFFKIDEKEEGDKE